MAQLIDQSLSTKNLRLIYDLDRKNKGDLEKVYFPEAFRIRERIYYLKGYVKRLQLRLKFGKITTSYYESRKDKVNNSISKRRDQYETYVDLRMKDLSDVVNRKGYRLDLEKLPDSVNGKDVYSIGREVDAIFVSRHLQKVLMDLYKVKMPNRDLIISQISNLILDGSPKYIIRADVESFYESIDHRKMLDILHSSPKLSVTPKRILTNLIKDYSAIVGEVKGLPRGVGLSSYLSEVFLCDIDDQLKYLKDAVYYSRYVDDIFIVFAPSSSNAIENYMSEVDLCLENKGLTCNHKTKPIDLMHDQKDKFEYLGYSFELNGEDKKIRISNNKLARYRSRIDLSISDYNKKKVFVNRKSERLLISRIRFLTGNTRLHNSKRNAFVGVYFGNKYINNYDQLHGLDQFFKSRVNRIPDERLRRKLLKLSFFDGFKDKVFRNFSTKELKNISKVWKHV